MAKCNGCGCNTKGKDPYCSNCVDPCATMSNMGPPDLNWLPDWVCTYIDTQTGCVYHRYASGGGFHQPLCPGNISSPPSCACTVTIGDQVYNPVGNTITLPDYPVVPESECNCMVQLGEDGPIYESGDDDIITLPWCENDPAAGDCPLTPNVPLVGCDLKGYTIPDDALVKGDQNTYTHTSIYGTEEVLHVPHVDFCIEKNQNCPSDGHTLDASTTTGVDTLAWEYKPVGGDWTAIGTGQVIENVTETAAGGCVRVTGTDPDGETWTETRNVDPVCCSTIEGSDENGSLGLIGGCFTVPPGTACGYWFDDFAGIADPDGGSPASHQTPQLVLDNTDKNCPSKFDVTIEVSAMQWHENAQGDPPSAWFREDNDVKLQVRMARCNDEAWLKETKYLSMYDLVDPADPSSSITGPSQNNGCDRFVSEDGICNTLTRNYSNATPDFLQQSSFRRTVVTKLHAELILPACTDAAFCIDPILFWDNFAGGAGQGVYFERWHLAMSAKVNREACG